MRYLALATDYDGTLATHGVVTKETLNALIRARESGRKLILVTGRQLDDLRQVFPEHTLFDRVVAENGALVFAPDTREIKLLGPSPNSDFVRRLQERNISPLSVGAVIVSTWEPHQTAIVETIRELGLELQVIFNKGAIMILPSGLNKANGVRAALLELGLSPHNALAVGDAENDHALLGECEFAAAVANALPSLKDQADWVAIKENGAGVAELVELLLANDLREFEPRLTRRDVALGQTSTGAPLTLPPYGARLLLCGTSGGGKSSLTAGFLEQLGAKGYQFCLVDPEGDFGSSMDVLTIGNEQQAPTVDEALELLKHVDKSVVINLLGLPLLERPLFFSQLLLSLEKHKESFGRPHWLIADEAHHLLPAGSLESQAALARAAGSLLLITVHLEHLPLEVVRLMSAVAVVGSNPQDSIAKFAAACGVKEPALPAEPLEPGEAYLWFHEPGRRSLERFLALPAQAERRRHQRKYATGSLGEDKSFYFKGPDAALNLRANNLTLFLQIAAGVDDRTWDYHLKRHDYSAWLKDAVKDDDLAGEVLQIEDAPEPALESRRRIKEAIAARYTLPA